MAQSVTLYNLLISCPGDVKDEVALVESAVDEFNELYADPLGITIKTRHWEKSSYAQSGGKPQVLLNEQFVNKCDAAVAIFWTRFGSPQMNIVREQKKKLKLCCNPENRYLCISLINLFRHQK